MLKLLGLYIVLVAFLPSTNSQEEEEQQWAVPGEGINPELDIEEGPVSKRTKLKIEDFLTKPNCDFRSDEGDEIYWKYKGTFLDGKEFDSGTFTAVLGQGHVIIGVDKGMRGMCVGDKRKMTIHSDWAYGDNGYGDIIPGGEFTFRHAVRRTTIWRPSRDSTDGRWSLSLSTPALSL